MTIAPGWESVIGLEIHVQLACESKLFSGASTRFGASANEQACAVDLALPGTLPVLNEQAVQMGIVFGLAIGAEIGRTCIFDRKNYFYPDLAKGYQISQFADPIVGTGKLTFTAADGTPQTIGITRAHLEEDAGKSIHDSVPGQTGIDYNRAGTPLLEIVTEPELTNAPDAVACLKRLHALVRYLRISDGNMNEGSFRCDANVSVRRIGETELGERTEIKNVNSFRFVERAIDYEIDRQIGVLESGGRIERATMLYDETRDETRPMRSKEYADDYRYFPEPDLLPVVITDEMMAAAAQLVPELPEAKAARYEQALELSAYDAAQLTSDPTIAEYFETALAISGIAKLTANWVMGDLAAALNRHDLTPRECPVTPEQLGTLVARIEDETLSSKTAKTAFEHLWQNAGTEAADVDAIIAEHGLAQTQDTGELTALVAQVVADNPAQVEQFKAGKTKLLGFFVGQIMKATGGTANPKQLNELLTQKLAE